MHSTSTIVLNSEALKSNIEFIRSRLGENVRLSSVVKGNAYGHGIETIAPMIEKCGVDHLVRSVTLSIAKMNKKFWHITST